FCVCRVWPDLDSECGVVLDHNVSIVGSLHPASGSGAVVTASTVQGFQSILRIGVALWRRLPCLWAHQSRADIRCFSGSCHAIALAQAPAYGGDPAGGTNPRRSGGLYPTTRAHGKDFSSSDVRGLLDLAVVAAAA